MRKMIWLCAFSFYGCAEGPWITPRFTPPITAEDFITPTEKRRRAEAASKEEADRRARSATIVVPVGVHTDDSSSLGVGFHLQLGGYKK